MTQKTFLVIFILAVGSYYLTSTPAQTQNAAHAQPGSWRHLALTSKNDDDATLAVKINTLGSDGWELVDVENFVSPGEPTKTVYYFKKPG